MECVHRLQISQIDKNEVLFAKICVHLRNLWMISCSLVMLRRYTASGHGAYCMLACPSTFRSAVMATSATCRGGICQIWGFKSSIDTQPW